MTCQHCRYFAKKLAFLGFRSYCSFYRRNVEPTLRCADFRPVKQEDAHA